MISFAAVQGGVATGSVSGSASRPSRSPPSCRPPTPPPAPGRPAEDAAELVARRHLAGLGRPSRRRPTSASTTRSRPRSARRSARPPARTGCSTASSTTSVATTYLGSSRGLRLRHVQPTGHYACTGKDTSLTRSAWTGGATRDFRDVDAAGDGGDGRPAPRLGRAPHRPARRALRHDPAAVVGRRPDDRRLLGRRRPRRPRGRVGLQPARRRHPDRRQGRRARASACSPTRPTPASSARRSSSPARPTTPTRSSTTASPLERTDWIRDGLLTGAAPDPPLRRDDRPAGHADDRQPRPRGRRRRRHASTTWSPARSAACC